MKEFATRRGETAPPTYQPDPPRQAPNAALLIDFDNVTMGIRSDLQQQLNEMLNSEVFKGKISVQRAYADWRRYPQYIVPLSEASIDLIFAPAFGSNKKNATDIRLAIDALELVFTRPEIGTFILLSGDSDFSSLVLKLKEYGKYIIGVGIRESSSDLLIQNCDEYFSYSDLTGLLKESDEDHQRRDPWELVVEAVLRMGERDDVMRSDRLKQVMQEIDTTFDEKDAGFSRYSKFLQEGQRRGLITLSKMDNGQYEIGLGNNANVPPDREDAATKARPRGESRSESRGGRSGGRNGERRRGRGREKEKDKDSNDDRDAGREKSRGRGRGRGRGDRGMSLARAFDLLRRALGDLGAAGDESTDADQALERMKELHDEDDPVFDEKRFPRLLRQAHDAGVIDLAKTGDDGYLLKLRPATDTDTDEDALDEQGTDAADDDRPRSRRGRRGGRGRRRGEDRDDSAAAGSRETTGTPDAEADTPSRNPRFRRGSRGGTGARTPAGGSEPAPGPVGPVAAGGDTPSVRDAAPPPSGVRRSVRGRRGRPAGRPDTPATSGPDFVPGPVDQPAASAPSRPATPEARPSTPRPEVPEAKRPAPPAEPPADAEDGQGGLFKRMTAAFQRAVSGEREPDAD